MNLNQMARLLALIALAGLLQSCFLLVVGGAGAEGGYVASQKDRKAGETVSDQWIHAKITTSLISHAKTKARNIDVTVFKGKVTLTGSVTSAEERETAVNLAKSVDGVSGVVDRLTLAR